MHVQIKRLPTVGQQNPRFSKSELNLEKEISPDPFVFTDEMKEKILAQRVGDLTLKKFENRLKAIEGMSQLSSSNENTVSDSNAGDAWLSQAVALIEKDSETLKMVSNRYRITKSIQERALILDLMIGAGSKKVQDSLTQLLNEMIEKNEVKPAIQEQLYQRLGILEEPDVTTVQFSLQQVDAIDKKNKGDLLPKDEMQRSAWITAATLTSKNSEHQEMNQGFYDKLSKTIAKAQSPFETEGLILAAGNTKNEIFVQSIREKGVQSGDAGLRNTAALALGSIPGEASDQALLTLMKDSNENIVATTLRAYRDRDESSLDKNWHEFQPLAQSKSPLVRNELLSLWESHPNKLNSSDIKVLKNWASNANNSGENTEDENTLKRVITLIERYSND